ncbi:Turtle-like protein A [Operophtera brumata]|uniref:Turtle-like protein A n=1 Tax=Operophtera brumata TaxID=104452 RepID=A0A0L7L4H0_OPEBR|nr:Turtle-like protein A [Operophtera brumata]
MERVDTGNGSTDANENQDESRSPENFQKFMYELFEKNGVLNDLRSYLRGHIISVLRSAQTVFISEIPLANMVFSFAKTLMNKLDIDDRRPRFKDNDVWCILNYLGRPAPTVMWLIDGTPAPQYIGEKTDTHVVVNRLELPHVKRDHLNTTFKCRASNTNLVMKPNMVEIQSKPATLSSERYVNLVCVSEGSRPAAQLTWYKDNRKFKSSRVKTAQANNETWVSSQIQFMPLPEDDGTQIKCQADNSALPGQSIEDSFKLDVVCDDVYFECSVKANPREHKISWYHNDKPVLQNVVSGVIVSTKSLVLQKVTRDHGGDYSCRATNALGETASEATHLSIQYAPVCTHPSPQVLGAQIEEELRVRCSVTANPPDVTFFWQFNNSTANGSTSELSYKPQSERDYGTLSCRGTNGVGRQLVRPHQGTAHCKLGTIVMKVPAVGFGSDVSLATTELDLAQLTSNGESESATFNLLIYSRNLKGESERTLLENIAFNDAARRTGDWSNVGAVFSAEDLALLDSAGRPQQLTPGSDLVSNTHCRQEDVLNQNLGQPVISANFRPNYIVSDSPTLGSPNFVCPNGNLNSPFGSQSLTLSGPTLSSGSLATSTLHRTKGKGNTRRREHVLAENLPGPESCV